MISISIITVNWNSYEWLDVLRTSLELHATYPYDLIVVDNSTNLQLVDFPKVHMIPQENNIGHGEGLNVGSRYAATLDNQFVMFLDVDCHFLQPGWEEAFSKLTEKYDVIGGRGVPQKPIRPACMFMKKEFSKYDWSATPGYKGHRVTPDGFDVAITAYHQMISDGVKIHLIESKPNHYNTLNGEEWCIDETPYVYHHWHGTHLAERTVDFPGKNLFADKDVLFSRIPWRQI